MIDDFEKKSIEFDIDQTLYYTDSSYNILEVNKKLIDLINKMYNKGFIIIIRTGRNWGLFDLTREQLKTVGVRYHSLLMGKPTCDYYVDDKGLRPEEFIEKFIGIL